MTAKDDKLLEDILNAYNDAELKITAKIQQLILIGLDNETIAKTLQAQKLAQLQELKAYTVKQLQELKSLDEAARQLVIRDFLAGASSVAGSQGSVAGTNSAALGNLLTEYSQGFSNSRYQILRSTVDAYRRIVSQVATQSALGVDTRLQTARRALDLFADEGITSFITADGRRWGIVEYSEMSTRTTLANAQRVGRLQQLENDGRDLIIVNAVPNPSPLCKPYERAILSISGKDNKYPSLDEAKSKGLWHANCRHSFTAYIAGLTQIDSSVETDNYDETQDLRYTERMTRRWKRRLEVADTPEAKQKAKDKIADWTNKAKDIADANNLVYKPNRLSNKAAH